MNNETLEQAAIKSFRENSSKGKLKGKHNYKEFNDYLLAFGKGSEWREQQAASGFEEWWDVNNYTDKYGRWHDKPCVDGKPSSNNGWYYSAIAKKLGIKVDVYIGACGESFVFRERHPYEVTTPYWSRDEEIGLRYLYPPAMKYDGWDFWPTTIPRPKFNLVQFIFQAIKCVDWKALKSKHRNYWWKQELWQIGYTAFSVPLSDRHFCLRLQGKYNLFYHIVHIVAHWKQPKDRSARLLRWFKTGKDIEAVANYFPKDHPFQEYV